MHRQVSSDRWGSHALITLIALILCGCGVTTIQPNQSLSLAPPIKMVLVQTPFAGDKAALQQVVAEGSTQKSSPETDAAILAALERAHIQASTELHAALGNAGVSITDKELVSGIVGNGLSIGDIGAPVTTEIAQQLHATSGADWLLRFHITDYGLTPKAWRKGVITFEVVSTLGIAAIAYLKPATRAIAGIYLAQEAIEETAEAYAGFWALDEVSRPVRIEAELTNLKTGDSVWRNSATGFSDTHLSRLVKTVNTEERRAQLQDALRQAVEVLAAKLRTALAKKLQPGHRLLGKPRSECDN